MKGRQLFNVILSVAVSQYATVGFGQEDKSIMQTIESQTIFREKVLPFLLLLTIVDKPSELADTNFLPKRFGLAVRVVAGDGVKIFSSAALLQGAEFIEVSEAARPEKVVHCKAREHGAGLAQVVCDATKEDTGASVAPAGSCDPGRTLYAVVPAGAGRFVVTATQVIARGEPLPEDLALVQGLLPQGTPLFDESCRVAAVVVRPALDHTRSLVAPLSPKAPASSEGGP